MSFLRYNYTMHGNGYNLHVPIVLKTLFSKFLASGTISHDRSQLCIFSYSVTYSNATNNCYHVFISSAACIRLGNCCIQGHSPARTLEPCSYTCLCCSVIVY